LSDGIITGLSVGMFEGGKLTDGEEEGVATNSGEGAPVGVFDRVKFTDEADVEDVTDVFVMSVIKYVAAEYPVGSSAISKHPDAINE